MTKGSAVDHQVGIIGITVAISLLEGREAHSQASAILCYPTPITIVDTQSPTGTRCAVVDRLSLTRPFDLV